jgi:hypothetical protein
VAGDEAGGHEVASLIAAAAGAGVVPGQDCGVEADDQQEHDEDEPVAAAGVFGDGPEGIDFGEGGGSIAWVEEQGERVGFFGLFAEQHRPLSCRGWLTGGEARIAAGVKPSSFVSARPFPACIRKGLNARRGALLRDLPRLRLRFCRRLLHCNKKSLKEMDHGYEYAFRGAAEPQAVGGDDAGDHGEEQGSVEARPAEEHGGEARGE